MTTIQKLKSLLKGVPLGKWSWEDNPPTLYIGRDNEHHGFNILGRLEPDWNGENTLNLIVEAINALPELLKIAEDADAYCAWRDYPDSNGLEEWSSACSTGPWQFAGATAEDYGVKFCPGCGRRVLFVSDDN